MNLFTLLESPKLGAPSNTPGAQDIGDQHSPSPVGSGTSKREAKKKPVTMMGVGVKESQITEVWEPINESLRDGEYYTFRVFFDDGTDETLNFSSDDIDWDRVGARRGKRVVNVKQQGGIRGSQTDTPSKPHEYSDDRGLARAQRAYDKQMPEGRGFAGTGGARSREDDERTDLDPTDWYVVKDGKMFSVSVYPRQVAQAEAQGYSRTREQARAKAESQGVAEGSSSDLEQLIQQYEDMVENVYGMVPGPRQRQAIADRDALEARIEAMPGGKAALEKWARAYNDGMDEGVAEGQADIVKFEVDSENAYNHIMDKFGSVIDWDGDIMVAPRRYWGAIQELAYAAGGEASEEQDIAEAVPYALSAANAAAEYRRQGAAGGGYRGRIDVPVQSREDYLAVGNTLTKAARAAGQRIEYGLSDGVMSIFSDSMTSDELDEFIDRALDQGLAEGFETEPVKLNPGDQVTYQGKSAEVMSVSGNNVTLRVAGSAPVSTSALNVNKAGVGEGSVQDKLHRRHQELRKKSGLPDPDYYKELRATYDLPDEERYAKAAELKKKYKVKEGILDRAAPKMPKPRNPAEKVLTAKRTSGAAGSHVNKKRQAQLQPKHRGSDELDESLKSKLAGAALAGALATGAAAGNLPDLVGKVTMNVNGQQVTKEFNLGNDYASPMAAQRDLERFLRDKGVTNFYIELQRAAPDNKFQPQDTRPGPYGARSVAGPGGVVDTAGQVARDVEGGNWKGAAEKAYKTYQQNKNADMGAVGRGELKDRIVRGVVGGLGLDESIDQLSEEMEQYLYQLDAAGYDILAEAEAIKGADGKRCWKGKRYAGTKNGKDICVDVNEEKKGLYYYVNQRKKKGTSRPKNDPKAPSAQDWKDAAKTAKK